MLVALQTSGACVVCDATVTRERQNLVFGAGLVREGPRDRVGRLSQSHSTKLGSELVT